MLCCSICTYFISANRALSSCIAYQYLMLVSVPVSDTGTQPQYLYWPNTTTHIQLYGVPDSGIWSRTLSILVPVIRLSHISRRVSEVTSILNLAFCCCAVQRWRTAPCCCASAVGRSTMQSVLFRRWRTSPGLAGAAR